MKPTQWVNLAGFTLVVTGLAFLHWPSALIFAGAMLMIGAAKVEKDTNAGKPQ